MKIRAKKRRFEVRTDVFSGAVTGESREECPAQKPCAAPGAVAFTLCLSREASGADKSGATRSVQTCVRCVFLKRVARPKLMRRVRLGKKDDVRQKQGTRSAQAHAWVPCPLREVSRAPWSGTPRLSSAFLPKRGGGGLRRAQSCNQAVRNGSRRSRTEPFPRRVKKKAPQNLFAGP